MRKPAVADWQGAALPGLAAVGGSHAQRALFEQLYVDALQRAGQLPAVQNLLQAQAMPCRSPSGRGAAWTAVYSALHLPALAPLRGRLNPDR